MEQSKFYQIKNITEHEYTLVGCDGSVITRSIQDVDKSASAFTIQDAKGGDVLINWNNTVFIFKAIEDETVKFHIAYNEKWDAIKTPSTKLSHLGLPEPQFEFQPATKEQRDLLFQKMHEAGYMWDSDSKQLLSLKAEPSGEQKPAWSEEEEHYIRQLESMVRERWALAEKAQDEEVIKSMSNLAFFLKTLNPNKKPSDEDMKTLLRTEYEKGRADAIAEMQMEWNEEDEIYYKRVQLSIEWARAHNRISEGSCDEQLNWLKSLRPQNKWKPSDGQIRFLQAMVNDPNNASSESCQIVLKDILEKLKKLKEG